MRAFLCEFLPRLTARFTDKFVAVGMTHILSAVDGDHARVRIETTTTPILAYGYDADETLAFRSETAWGRESVVPMAQIASALSEHKNSIIDGVCGIGYYVEDEVESDQEFDELVIFAVDD
jgi:hypothetical protein